MSTGKGNGDEREEYYLAVLWSVLTLVLAVTGIDAQPTMTVTMRLAEAE
jgi:hypothetical protein